MTFIPANHQQSRLFTAIIIITAILAWSFFGAGPAAAQAGRMTITYCDGRVQVVPLHQPSGNIKGISFTCGQTGGGSGSGVFGGTTYIAGGFKGNIYFLAKNTSRLPNFGAMRPVGTIYVRSLNVPNQDFTAGFPGVTNRNEWFGLRYTARFNVNTAGQYRFRIASDDGSKVWIDGRLLLSNDGIHPFRSVSANVHLAAGQHSIQVDYFQGPRVRLGLQLFVTPPGGAERIFSPQQVLSGAVQTGRTVKLFNQVTKRNSSAFKASRFKRLRMDTQRWDRTPYNITRPFQGRVVIPRGARVYLSASPNTRQPVYIDNFFLFSYKSSAGSGVFVVGDHEPVYWDNHRIRKFGPQSQSQNLDLTSQLPQGVAVDLMVYALDYGGVGGVSNVYLFIR